LPIIVALQLMVAPHEYCPSPGSYDAKVARYRALENEVDRGTGRIVDEQTYLLDHAQLVKRADDRVVYQSEPDPWLRIDAKQPAEQREAKRPEAQQREAEMRLKEYELYINAGLMSAVGDQAEHDRIALQEAKARRDQALKTAAGGNDAAARKAIEQTYQTE